MLRVCQLRRRVLFEALASDCLTKQGPSITWVFLPLSCDLRGTLSLGDEGDHKHHIPCPIIPRSWWLAAFFHAAEPY